MPILTLLKNAPYKLCFIRKCSAEISRSWPWARIFTRCLPGFDLGATRSKRLEFDRSLKWRDMLCRVPNFGRRQSGRPPVFKVGVGANLLRHGDGVDLNGGLAADLRGSRDPSWDLFVPLLCLR